MKKFFKNAKLVTAGVIIGVVLTKNEDNIKKMSKKLIGRINKTAEETTETVEEILE